VDSEEDITQLTSLLRNEKTKLITLDVSFAAGAGVQITRRHYADLASALQRQTELKNLTIKLPVRFNAMSFLEQAIGGLHQLQHLALDLYWNNIGTAGAVAVEAAIRTLIRLKYLQC